MLFTELVAFSLLGCGFGIITGLVPGVHINTISAIVLAAMPALVVFEPLSVAAMLLAMAVTHTFLDFIPSILFGAPEGETALGVLPGHRMLLQGRAVEAIKITGVGSLISLIITAGLFLVVLGAVESLYGVIRPVLHWALFFIVVMSFATERKVFSAIGVFLLAGLFGIFTLSCGLFGNDVLFPALSGMFGVSTLYLSTREGACLPRQVRARVGLGWWPVLKNSALGAVAGMMVGLLPGIGAAQATYMTQQVSRSPDVREFLVAVSGVNTANIIFTVVVLYALGKMRSGVTVAINEVIGWLDFNVLLCLLAVILFAGGVAFFLHFKIGVWMARKLGKSGAGYYQLMNWGIIALVVVLVAVMTGLVGLLVLGLGAALGLVAPLRGVRRANCMGYFLFPVMLFYFGFGLGVC